MPPIRRLKCNVDAGSWAVVIKESDCYHIIKALNFQMVDSYKFGLLIQASLRLKTQSNSLSFQCIHKSANKTPHNLRKVAFSKPNYSIWNITLTCILDILFSNIHMNETIDSK
ncbi:hypothetical protein Gotur_019836 [Gossypium turneri]